MLCILSIGTLSAQIARPTGERENISIIQTAKKNDKGCSREPHSHLILPYKPKNPPRFPPVGAIVGPPLCAYPRLS